MITNTVLSILLIKFLWTVIKRSSSFFSSPSNSDSILSNFGDKLQCDALVVQSTNHESNILPILYVVSYFLNHITVSPPPSNFFIEVLTPIPQNVILFVFMVMSMRLVKMTSLGGPSSNITGDLIERGNLNGY